MLISEGYRELNRRLHAEVDGYGRSSRAWAALVARMMDDEGHADALDYGCGKGELKQILPRLPIAEYDPAIEGKEAAPAPADLVICTDVLEHIEPAHINAVIRDLRRVTKRKLLLVVATHPSIKTLADGRNAHLLVKPGSWWREKIKAEFRILFWEERPGTLYCEAFPRAVTRPAHLPAPMRRRTITQEWRDKFDEVRRISAETSDAFGRIESIRMFESVDDEPADMQVICNMLEAVDDIDMAIRRAISMTRKTLMITLAASDDDLKMWRTPLERLMHIGTWVSEDGKACIIGSPAVHVQGIKGVGAMTDDSRFEQVKLSVARISKRIVPVPAHGKRAILACYGPSLKANIKTLKQEASEIDSAIVSVSGAHDFLLEHGLKPHMHVECDPRPHKVKNLTRPQDDVAYYIASVCNQNLFDCLEGRDVRLWHVHDASHQERLIGELGEHPQTSMSGGGSVGLRSIPLLYSLGYRDFSVYGMDCSFDVADATMKAIVALQEKPTSPEWEAKVLTLLNEGAVQQWAGKHGSDGHKGIVPCICGTEVFATAPILLTYATQFFELVQKCGPEVKVRLYGEGLLQSMARLYSQMPRMAA